jgi:hypothetical protein
VVTLSATATTASAKAARLLAWTAVATAMRVVTLMVGPRAGFALAAVGSVVTLAGAHTILTTGLGLLTLQTRAITLALRAATAESVTTAWAAGGAGLTAAIAAMLTIAAGLTAAAAAATAVTSTTAEAAAVASTTVTPHTVASAIAATSVGRRARGRGNYLELRQAGHRQRPLEHPLDIFEQ